METLVLVVLISVIAIQLYMMYMRAEEEREEEEERRRKEEEEEERRRREEEERRRREEEGEGDIEEGFSDIPRQRMGPCGTYNDLTGGYCSGPM